MTDTFNDSAHWRRRAQEMRTFAESVSSDAARASMLKIAEEYDRLAERATMRSKGQT